jgi:hypothetical protein
VREREDALERREEVVRAQAERIGRLEREVELLRARLTRLDPTEGQADQAGQVEQTGTAITGAATPGVAVQDEALVLSAQVARLRGDLRSLAVHLEQGAAFARPAPPPEPENPSPAPFAPHVPEPPAPPAPPAEIQNAPPAPVSDAPDPFAEAAVAIRQLQAALQAHQPPPPSAPASVPAPAPGDPEPPEPSAPAPEAPQPPERPAPAPEAPPQAAGGPQEVAPLPSRRPWWRFWRRR